VISGDGELIIAKIGELVDRCNSRREKVSQVYKSFENLQNIAGQWIIGWVNSGQIITLSSRGYPIDRNCLPAPCEIFGVQTSFNVFKGRLTAHAFSDMGNGCAYDCAFCSERLSITGPLAQSETSADRLFGQLRSAVRVIAEDTPMFKASAFIEDSTLLAGSNTSLYRFIDLLSKADLDIRFGGQFTIDQILNKTEVLRHLKEVGLDYLFIGLETEDPDSVGGMSKNTKVKKESWIGRAEKCFENLAKLGITCGVALLFGLGETRESRIRLFNQLDEWRVSYGFPNPISLNWAVQHPLRGDDGGMGYTYHQWGTPPGAYLEAFLNFGEASLYYPLAGRASPTLEEVLDVQHAYKQYCAAMCDESRNPLQRIKANA